MTARSQCPVCESYAIEALTSYRANDADFFRCLKCLHVWNVPKGADGPVQHNTPTLVPPGE